MGFSISSSLSIILIYSWSNGFSMVEVEGNGEFIAGVDGERDVRREEAEGSFIGLIDGVNDFIRKPVEVDGSTGGVDKVDGEGGLTSGTSEVDGEGGLTSGTFEVDSEGGLTSGTSEVDGEGGLTKGTFEVDGDFTRAVAEVDGDFTRAVAEVDGADGLTTEVPEVAMLGDECTWALGSGRKIGLVFILPCRASISSMMASWPSILSKTTSSELLSESSNTI